MQDRYHRPRLAKGIMIAENAPNHPTPARLQKAPTPWEHQRDAPGGISGLAARGSSSVHTPDQDLW